MHANYVQVATNLFLFLTNKPQWRNMDLFLIDRVLLPSKTDKPKVHKQYYDSDDETNYFNLAIIKGFKLEILVIGWMDKL